MYVKVVRIFSTVGIHIFFILWNFLFLGEELINRLSTSFDLRSVTLQHSPVEANGDVFYVFL